MGKATDIRQQEIIDATLALAAEQGVGRITTQAIADRVGIAQPTVFRHFKNRDAILEAVVARLAENLFELLDELAAEALPADERLHQLLRRQMAFVNERRGFPRILFSDRLHVESPALKEAVRMIYLQIIRRISDLLGEGIESGRFRRGLDLQQTALFIGALLQGTVLRWSIMDFAFPLEEAADPMWEFLWPVLRPLTDGPGVDGL